MASDRAFHRFALIAGSSALACMESSRSPTAVWTPCSAG